MKDRLSAFDGTFEINSPEGGSTQVSASIPLLLHRGESGVARHVSNIFSKLQLQSGEENRRVRASWST